ncbi:MAG: PHP domain-containing protein [Permianibacter sp.]
MPAYDLHCHSFCSDGELSPAALVARASARGVQVLALSDHDSVAGLPEARAAAQVYGLTLVPAVEISVTYQKLEIHVVGLAVDPTAAALCQGLQAQQTRRWRRAEAMADKLAKEGVADLMPALRARFPQAAPTRSHFAQLLVERGLVRDNERAFARYIGRKGSSYVPAEWATLAEGVQWIRAAGGIPVLAHPGRYGLSGSGLERLLDEFVAAGGQAMELSYPQLFPKEAQKLARSARKRGLWASQGSDFHSPAQTWTELGKMPPQPPDVITVWQARPELFPLPPTATNSSTMLETNTMAQDAQT